MIGMIVSVGQWTGNGHGMHVVPCQVKDPMVTSFFCTDEFSSKASCDMLWRLFEIVILRDYVIPLVSSSLTNFISAMVYGLDEMSCSMAHGTARNHLHLGLRMPWSLNNV